MISGIVREPGPVQAYARVHVRHLWGRRSYSYTGLVLLMVLLLQACSLAGAGRSSVAGQARPSARAAASDPQSQTALDEWQKAESAYLSKDWSEAESLYRSLLAVDPDNAYIWFRLGNIMTRTARYRQAVYAFESSLKFDETQAKPWFNLVTAHALGARSAALKALSCMSINDPARHGLEYRLELLNQLLE